MKTSMIRNLLIAAIALVVLLTVLFAYLMSSRLSSIKEESDSITYTPAKFNKDHPISIVYELQSMSLASSLAALDTTTNASSDFDKVAGFLPKIHHLRAQLLASELNAMTAPKEMRAAIGRFVNLTKANEEAIEQFKTNHAAVRNSQRYLPMSYDVLLTLQQDSAADDAGKRDRLDDIKRLNNHIHAFLRNPSASDKELISKKLLELEEYAMSEEQKISNALLNYTSHAAVLLERKLPMTDILERISDDSIRDIDDEIVKIYQQMIAQQQSEVKSKKEALAKQYSFYINIVLLLGVLLAVLGIVGYILTLREKTSSVQQLMLMTRQKDAEHNKQVQLLEKSQISTSTDANMSYVSRMVASLTHEINTPLGYLSSNMDILSSANKVIQEIIEETDHCKETLLNKPNETEQREAITKLSETIDVLKEDSLLDELPEIIADMNTGVEQIQHLINDLKMFSGTDRAKREWFSLNECIVNVLKLSSVTIGSNIKVLKKFADIPEFYGSRGKITQIFTNLVNNSVHAIEEGNPDQGVIKIITASKGNAVLIEFMDNGIGIESENSKKVFEPFFTTKDPSKGTGLGLAIVSQIVKQHKGKIVVRSKLGQGTSFKLAFPVKK